MLCKNHPYFVKHQCFVNNKSLFSHQNWWSCNSQLTLCLGIFSFFVKHCPKIGLVFNWCHWCDMMWDVMLCDMMRWYDAKNDANAEDTHPHWNTQSLRPLRNDRNLFAVYFSASPLIFRCKFCIPLGTSFELLRLLFRRYRVDFSRFALYFGGIWLCIPFGTTFEQKTYTVLP